MWGRVLIDVLPRMRDLVPAGNQVLETAYGGDALLGCYLFREMVWQIRRLDMNPNLYKVESEHAHDVGLEAAASFRCCFAE